MDRTDKIIGRRDRIDLPGLSYKNIRAKIDTGAYGCAIHCSHIEVIRKEGKNVLEVVFLGPEYSAYDARKFYFSDFREKRVKNSGGEAECRYIISTDVIVFRKRFKTEFSLTNRSQMKYPVLLGRKFLRHHFLVDVRLKDVSFKLKNSRNR